MFIIYGTRGKELTGEYVPSIPCKHCGETCLSSRGGMRYFHIFWIPIFITSRVFDLVCSNCNHTVTKEDLSKEEIQRVKPALFTPRRTIPYYAGAFLILIVALGSYFEVQATKQKQVAMLNSPQVNDVYRVDLSVLFPDLELNEYKYAAMKITSLKNDGIMFVISKEAYNRDYGLSRSIKKDFPAKEEYYEDSGILIPYDEVVALYNNDTIKGIHRFQEMSNERPAQVP